MASSQRRPITADDLWALKRVGNPTVSRDGTRVVVPITHYDIDANLGTTRLFRISPDGEPRVLTADGVSSTQPAVSPDGSGVAFVRKHGDGDQPQIFVMPLDGGEARCVSEFPLGAASPRWMPNGRQIICLGFVYAGQPRLADTKRRHDEEEDSKVSAKVTEDRFYRFWDDWLTDRRVAHLFSIDLHTHEIVDLTPDMTFLFDPMEPVGQFDIAPDGSEIVFSANMTEPPYDELRWAIFRLTLSTGTITCLTPDYGADASRPRYSPDGTSIAYGMQRDPHFYADRVRLVLLDRASDEHTVVTEDWDYSASSWEWTPDSSALVLHAEHNGRALLFRLPRDAREPRPLLDAGSNIAPQPAGDGYVYFNHASIDRPPCLARIPEQGGALQRLTHVNDETEAAFELGKVDEITFTGADGDDVQMFVVHPPEFDSSRRWPLVHLIHGGPHGIFGDQFHFRWNAHAFAAPGYVVAMVNFHGSTSFGQRFAQCIQGAWGDKPLTDIMAATDTLIERGIVDPERIAVTGGSYGGYMTAWLTSQSNRFCCAVCHAGVTNLPGMYATDVTQGLHRSQGGTPWDGRDGVERWSPSAHAAGFATPTLVIHGEKDYRVPITQGLELYGVLKAKGVPARLVYYPDENHWILKPQNSLHWYSEVLGWLERHLQADPAAVERQVAAAKA